jgi:CheY-like chemotaxis protein
MANILIVDDDEQYPLMLAKMLKQHSHDATIANSGEEALKLCVAQKFDLIITDILMPDIDGIDLIMKLKERNSMAPIIAISGGDNHTLAHSPLQSASVLGAHSTLQKPFTDGCLLKAVENALGS